MVDKRNPLPLHYQLTNELKKMIKNGEYKVGDLFATDKHLMEKYNVSSTTVRRALSVLVNDGYLERIPGKGTFVKKDCVEEDLERLVGFFEQMREKGMEPSAEIVGIDTVEITDEILDKNPELNFFNVDRLLLFKIIQKMNGKPVVYLRTYWPYEIGMKLKNFDLATRGIYEICSSELNIYLDEADQTIYSNIADDEKAKYLGIRVGSPLLCEKREEFMDGKPLELSYSFYPADRYKYKVKLRRNSTNGGKGVILP